MGEDEEVEEEFSALHYEKLDEIIQYIHRIIYLSDAYGKYKETKG